MKIKLFAYPLAIATVLIQSGCGGSPSSGMGSFNPLTSGGASSIYVIQNSTSGPNTILQFPATSNGSVSAAATLSLPASFTASALATDSSAQIYVAGILGSQYEILVYSAGASGTPAPARTVLESGTTILPPLSIAVDSAGTIYVLGQGGGIAVYAATANGASSPARLIQGALTQMSGASELTVDAVGNIYVTSSVASVTGTAATGAILIFAPAATGNVAPLRIITATPQFTGIAVDSGSNIYAAEDTETTNSVTGAISTSAALVEFSSSATGAAAPLKSIAGAATGLTLAGGLSRDAAGNLYVVNAVIPASGSVTFDLLGYGSNASGNAAPAVNFNSSAWSNAGEQLALK